jgi:hypothetical protein
LPEMSRRVHNSYLRGPQPPRCFGWRAWQDTLATWIERFAPRGVAGSRSHVCPGSRCAGLPRRAPCLTSQAKIFGPALRRTPSWAIRKSVATSRLRPWAPRPRPRSKSGSPVEREPVEKLWLPASAQAIQLSREKLVGCIRDHRGAMADGPPERRGTADLLQAHGTCRANLTLAWELQGGAPSWVGLPGAAPANCPHRQRSLRRRTAPPPRPGRRPPRPTGGSARAFC